MTPLQERLPSALISVASVSAAVAAGLLALFSLRWPIVHDLPIFLYDGYLMQDLGRVPFRDFFETNTPGTMVLSAALHGLINGGSLAARIVDLSVLAMIAGCTMIALRGHGPASGALASACFALAYLSGGPIQSLQREYITILPLALSTAIVFRTDRSLLPGRLAIAATGLLAGIATCIKPPLLLCWAPLVMMAAGVHARAESATPRRIRRVATGVLLPFLLGLALPLAGVVAWLAYAGALEPYLEILANYYPLYMELNGDGFLWQPGLQVALLRYVVRPLQLIPAFPFVALSFLGLGLAWAYRRQDLFLQCLAICGLVGAALLYVAITGKFWVYHRFPLYFALALLAGLAASRHVARSPGESAWLSAIMCLALFIGLPVQLIGGEYLDWRAGRTFEVKDGRVDLITAYLEHHTSPTDTVMPLDVTSGAIHAMYRNRRPLHGRFVYDLQFHHHVDHPYVQKLRRELMAQFENGDPDIVIRMDNTWLRRGFPDLDARLEQDYDVVLKENEVTILRRRVR